MDQDGASYLDTDNKLRIHTQFWNERPTPPGPGGSTGAPLEGQLEVLQLLGLQPDTGGPGPAPQPLGTGGENRPCLQGQKDTSSKHPIDFSKEQTKDRLLLF